MDGKLYAGQTVFLKENEMNANQIAQECINWVLKARLLHWFPLLDLQMNVFGN